MHTSADQAFSLVQKLAQAYTERVRHLPYVRQVLLARTGKHHHLYTVVEAPFTDFKQAYPLYRAEQEVRGGRDLLSVDFVIVQRTADALEVLLSVPGVEPRRWRKGVQVLYDRAEGGAARSAVV